MEYIETYLFLLLNREEVNKDLLESFAYILFASHEQLLATSAGGHFLSMVSG